MKLRNQQCCNTQQNKSENCNYISCVKWFSLHLTVPNAYHSFQSLSKKALPFLHNTICSSLQCVQFIVQQTTIKCTLICCCYFFSTNSDKACFFLNTHHGHLALKGDSSPFAVKDTFSILLMNVLRQSVDKPATTQEIAKKKKKKHLKQKLSTFPFVLFFSFFQYGAYIQVTCSHPLQYIHSLVHTSLCNAISKQTDIFTCFACC